jgi:hypothetical protein
VRDAADYLRHVKALIALNRNVVRWEVIREEALGDVGLLRYRLTLRDGGLLEMFERFQVTEEALQVTKYSFHWQSADGELCKRWDNAAHHPEVPTHPHHVHDGADTNVVAHGPTSAEDVLASLGPKEEE